MARGWSGKRAGDAGAIAENLKALGLGDKES